MARDRRGAAVARCPATSCSPDRRYGVCDPRDRASMRHESAIWPWLAPDGSGVRGGAYTYDWIENLFGLNMHSADRVLRLSAPASR